MTRGRAEKAPESENVQTDSDRDDSSQSQGLTLTEQTQTPSQTLTSDSRGRMINDVMTLAAEVQRLVGQISQDGELGGGDEGEEGERVGSLPPPYSPSS